ncbi:Dicer-like protein 1 [Coemansia erecta]|uniref:Dicer-like protein 1 n=1 Tax=Coemansia erecta TaxID=147472 RepID=A0A9W8CTE8_9FUNG|nr:Dicer-like protein 1 [Coemansia erecta]
MAEGTSSLTDVSSADTKRELDEWHSKLMPRDYQLALFREALRDNSIVMLETGTGKTLVSVMLIQWFSQRAASVDAQMNQQQQDTSITMSKHRRKTRVFLNNTVALVYQQARVISENTDQKVHAFVGATGVNDWDDSRWSEKWKTSSVLVMTHQVLLNALRAGRAHMSDIDLLVFDECHHARGNHPYALIMREFYDRCDPEDRPHVFGMTASPLNAKQTAQESVMHLQTVLDSNVCTVDLTSKTDVPKLQQTSLCYEYLLPPDYSHTPLTLTLAEKCAGSVTVESAMKLVPVLMGILGPYGVDQMWHHYIRQWHRKVLMRPVAPRNPLGPSPEVAAAILSASTNLRTALPIPEVEDGELGEHMDIDSGLDTSRDGIESAEILELQSATGTDQDPQEDARHLRMALDIDSQYGGHQFRTLDLQSDLQKPAVYIGAAPQAEADDKEQDFHPTPLLHSLSMNREPWSQVRSRLTPQVNRLLSILHQWCSRPTELRGIVFTSRRVTAVLLTYIVSRISEFGYIRTDVLLGMSSKQNTSIANRPIRSGSVKAANQAVLDDFASGRLNLIFATQVAEEGVDIQPCNLVIRFDMPNTTTSLIQSRGRARMAGSQFIVMVPEIDLEQKASIENSGNIPTNAPTLIRCEPDIDKAGDDIEYGEIPDLPGYSESLGALGHSHKPEQHKTYADYMQLISLENCLREWCTSETRAQNQSTTDGVITSDRSYEAYGLLLQRLRNHLVVDSDYGENDADDEPWIERKDSTGRIYTIVATQACITYTSAISIVQRYIQTLPQDNFFKLTLEVIYEEKTTIQARQPTGPAPRKKSAKPVVTSVYRCVLMFPSNAALRKVVGPFMPKKKTAKQVAMYRAAKKLHQLGAIDDNLIPVVEAGPEPEPESNSQPAAAEKSQKPKAKGDRASVEMYEKAVPSSLRRPLNAMSVEGKADASGRAETASNGSTHSLHPEVAEHGTYVPSIWQLYTVSFKHPSSPSRLTLVIATAQPLPENTGVPLYLLQFTKGNTHLDSSQTFIEPRFIGSRFMTSENVDTLAMFSSRLLMRISHTAQVWNTTELGFLLAPLSSDGLGLDFDSAKTMLSSRTPLLTLGNADGVCDAIDLSQLEGKVVMDGLDHGRIKVIEKVCYGVDLFADIVDYHARSGKHGGNATPADSNPTAVNADQLSEIACSSTSSTAPTSPISCDGSCETAAEQVTDSVSATVTNTPELPANTISKRQKIKNVKKSARTLAEWAVVKRCSSLLPRDDIGRGVPVFKVKSIHPAFNYLTPSIVHVASATGETSIDGSPTTAPAPVSDQRFPDAVYTSPFLCTQEPFDIYDMYNLSILPAFCVRLEQVLLANDIKKQLELRAKPETIRKAITASSSNSDVNYERLETLGDSVLKLITTVALFVSHPNDHEGLLSSRRVRMVSNANLFTLSRRLGLPGYIIAQVFCKREIKLPGMGWQRLANIPFRWVVEAPCTTKRESLDSTKKSDSQITLVEAPSSAPDGSEPAKPESSPQLRKRPEHMAYSTSRSLSEKTVADVIESLLGASYLDGGFEGALHAAMAMGAIKPNWTSWTGFNDTWHAKTARRKHGLARLNTLCQNLLLQAQKSLENDELLEEIKMDQEDMIYSEAAMQTAADGSGCGSQLRFTSSLTDTSNGQWVYAIEKRLGYTFRNRAILVEALTHCSMNDSISDSYQRLEVLGDAIVDLFVTERYYNYTPELSPYRITLVKHVAVSNNLFAVIVACNGLHRYIRHSSPSLGEAIADYEGRLDTARKVWAASQSTAEADANMVDSVGAEQPENEAAAWDLSMVRAQRDDLPADDSERPAKIKRLSAAVGKSAEDDDVYRDLPPECWTIVDSPKVLGDIFESLIGAIYVDSGMDNEVARAAYARLLSPFLDRFVDSGKLSQHPVIQSQLICQGWGCDSITWHGRANENLLEFVNKYICEVRLHDQAVAIGMGESPRHAKYNASSLFLQRIGATAPNTLSGNLTDVEKSLSGSTAIEKILKPLCNCKERRQAEALANANAHAAAATTEAEVEMDVDCN